eukprot:jgi/Botrbrau1/13252/Bobra.0074s0001.1
MGQCVLTSTRTTACRFHSVYDVQSVTYDLFICLSRGISGDNNSVITTSSGPNNRSSTICCSVPRSFRVWVAPAVDLVPEWHLLGLESVMLGMVRVRNISLRLWSLNGTY